MWRPNYDDDDVDEANRQWYVFMLSEHNVTLMDYVVTIKTCKYDVYFSELLFFSNLAQLNYLLAKCNNPRQTIKCLQFEGVYFF